MVLMDDENRHTERRHMITGTELSLHLWGSFMNSSYGIPYVHLILIYNFSTYPSFLIFKVGR